MTPQLKLGTDVIWVGSQWYVGDDANQNVKLADYWVSNLHGSYQLTKELQIYGVIKNLFNRKFATFGTYFAPKTFLRNQDPTRTFVPPREPCWSRRRSKISHQVARSGVNCERAGQSSDGPPHHHAGTAAVYLRRDAPVQSCFRLAG